VSDSLVVLGRVALVVVTLWVLQSSLFTLHVVASVQVGVLVAASVAAGIVGGPQRGAATGFALGVALDLLLITPFGLGAMTCTLTGYGAGVAGGMRLRQSRVYPLVIGLLGGASAVLVFAVAGELVGQPYLSNPDLVRTVLVQAGATAVLVLPLGAIWRRAFRPPAERRMVVA
jgi:rod shape-determining protein MreD